MLDREPLALQCALLSARACGLPHVADPRNFGPVNVEGEASTLRGLLTAGHSSWSGLNGKSNAASPSIEAGLLDWLDPVGIEGLGRFDVVIACDVLYEDFSVEPVAALLPRLVGTRSGDIILADPPDRTRRNRERFLELLRTGLQEVRLKEFGRRSVTLEDLTSDVQVLLFRKTYGGMTSTIGIR